MRAAGRPCTRGAATLASVAVMVVVAATAVVASTWGTVATTEHDTSSGVPRFLAAKSGLDDVDGVPLAQADFDNDRYTDLFMANSATNSFWVSRWSSSLMVFEKLPGTVVILPSGSVVENVVVLDVNGDGCLDAIVFTRTAVAPAPASLSLYKGNCIDSLVLDDTIALPNYLSGVQPFVADIYGTLVPGLVGYFASSSDISELSFLNLQTGSVVTLKDTGMFDFSAGNLCPISAPHSVALADMDGDCLADIVLTCATSPGDSTATSLQIWRNRPSEGTFILSRTYNLPSGVGQLTFADMDGDGTLDILTTICQNPLLGSKSCKLVIYYNKQIELCKYGVPWKCRNYHDLCTPDSAFRLFDSTNIMEIPISNVLPVASISTSMSDFTSKFATPIPIRVGDYNSDGFLDILVSTSQGVEILESTACTTATGCSSGKRSYKRLTSGKKETGPMSGIGNTLSAVFVDLQNDGALDVLTIQLSRDVVKSVVSGSKITLSTFVNSAVMNGFYLNVATVDKQRCVGKCGPVSSGMSMHLGRTLAGVSYKYTLVEGRTGHRRARETMQSSQQSYMELQTPFVGLGLGIDNNYVENLFVGTMFRRRRGDGSNAAAESHFAWFQALLPNAELVVGVEYDSQDVEKPDVGGKSRLATRDVAVLGAFTASEVRSPRVWRTVLFLHPDDRAFAATLVIAAAVAILAATASVLQLLEDREDRLEKARSLHRINFGAL